ncbi:hypothetical protein [Photorhabdus temperata]|nr:hypothetical protein [Photorhabdus temperata]
MLRPFVENEALAAELEQEQTRRNQGGLYRDEENNLLALRGDEEDE